MKEKEPKKRGRKQGKKIKPETVVFYRRVTPEEKKSLETFLKNLRGAK